MALADRTPPPVRKGPRCASCDLHDSLTPEDRDTLTMWLDRSRLTAKQILAMLADEGYEIGLVTEANLGNHRRRGCYGRRDVSV